VEGPLSISLDLAKQGARISKAKAQVAVLLVWPRGRCCAGCDGAKRGGQKRTNWNTNFFHASLRQTTGL